MKGHAPMSSTPSRTHVAVTSRVILTILAAAAAFPFETTMCVAASPTVEWALSLQPFFRDDIEIDQPDAETAARCTLEMEVFDGVKAWVVRDPNGVIIRAFPDTNADKVVDQWIFFKNGVEVYRDIDSNFDAKADRSRTSARATAVEQRPAARSQTRRPSVRR